MGFPVFPIFGVKVKKKKVIACGGGGDKAYGKKNGIVVLDETTYKDLAFYETDDLFENVEVFDPDEDTESFEEEEVDCLGDGDAAKFYDSEENDLKYTIEGEDSESNGHDVGGKEKYDRPEDEAECRRNDKTTFNNDDVGEKRTNKDVDVPDEKKAEIVAESETTTGSSESIEVIEESDREIIRIKGEGVVKIVKEESFAETCSDEEKHFCKKSSGRTDSAKEGNVSTMGKLFIACCGLENFYLLKLEDNKFSEMKRIKRKVDFIIYKNYLIFLSQNGIYGYYDVEENPDLLNDALCPPVRYKRPKDSCLIRGDVDHEEYFYTMHKRRGNILFRREEGTRAIQSNWQSFFIAFKRIHKVIIEDGKYCFVFRGKRYMYENEICFINYNRKRELLVFVERGRDTTLHSINIDNNELIFQISKITCVGYDGTTVSVGTGDGIVHVLTERDHCMIKASDFPITGVGYCDGYAYFTSFNGLIDRKKITKKRMHLRYAILLFILIGIFVAFFRR
jgi:hypothetical protein